MTIDPLARLLPSSVAIHAVAYTAGDASVWREWLSPEEQACIASFGAESRRREFLAGRAAARQLLAPRLDTTPDRVPLRRADDDAVDVVGADWRVSIAHSGGRALAGCARHPVGVDLEHIEPRDPSIADFLFAPEDRGLIDELPFEADTALILCWTLKEATLKARRTGFRTSPKDLTLTVHPTDGVAAVNVAGGDQWAVYFAMMDGYWGAVAVPAS